MKNLKEQLRDLVLDNKIDRFFDEIEVHLSDGSDLVDLVGLLQRRYKQLRLQSVDGSRTAEQINADTNDLCKDILTTLKMADEDDFKAAQVQPSVQYYYTRIAAKQIELQDITNKRASGIEKIGTGLIKLGEMISTKRNELDPSIPFHRLLETASKKAWRRSSIGCQELREVRLYQNKTFRELIDQYTQLVHYMDMPEEEMDGEKIAQLQKLFANMRQYTSNLSNAKGRVNDILNQAIQQIDQFIALQPIVTQALQKEDAPAIDKSIQITFTNFNDIRGAFEQTCDFFVKDDEEMDQLISQMNDLVAELELCIKAF